MNPRIVAAMVTAVVSLAPSGCHHVRLPTPRRAHELRLGMARSEVDAIMGRRGWHQFTASIDGVRVSGIDYRYLMIDDRRSTALSWDRAAAVHLFDGEALVGIIESPSLAAWPMIGTGSELDAVLRHILQAPRITVAAYNDRVQRNAIRGTEEPIPLLALITGLGSEPRPSERQRRQWAARYDPRRIEFGALIARVEDTLGEPLHAVSWDDGTELRLYGPREDLMAVQHIGVVYHDGRATHLIGGWLVVACGLVA